MLEVRKRDDAPLLKTCAIYLLPNRPENGLGGGNGHTPRQSVARKRYRRRVARDRSFELLVNQCRPIHCYYDSPQSRIALCSLLLQSGQVESADGTSELLFRVVKQITEMIYVGVS